MSGSERNVKMDVNDLSVAALSGIFSLLGLILNYLVFRSVKKKRRRPMLLKGLLILTMIDLLISLIILPLYSVQMTTGVVNDKQQLTHFVILPFQRLAGYTLSVYKISTATYIAFQMFFSAVTPFFYISQTNREKSTKFLLIYWSFFTLMTTIFSVILPQYWKYYRLVLRILAASIFIAICILYRYVRRAIHHRRNTTNEKTVKLSTRIILVFLLSYIPGAIYYLYTITIGNVTYDVYRLLQPWLVLISLSSSFLDPFVHYWTLKVEEKRRTSNNN